MQGEEIAVAWQRNGAWNAPAPITNDTNPDWNPTLAVDGAGRVVAVWERSRRGDLTEQSELLEFVQSQEIAYAVYNPATSAWSSPAFLSNNNYVDHTPRLAAASDGRILLVWQANAGNELEGDAAGPDMLNYAIWNNGAWSAPAQLGPALGDLAGWGIAYRGAAGMIVAARDTDGDPDYRRRPGTIPLDLEWSILVELDAPHE